jgi:hypothetical protein
MKMSEETKKPMKYTDHVARKLSEEKERMRNLGVKEEDPKISIEPMPLMVRPETAMWISVGDEEARRDEARRKQEFNNVPAVVLQKLKEEFSLGQWDNGQRILNSTPLSRVSAIDVVQQKEMKAEPVTATTNCEDMTAVDESKQQFHDKMMLDKMTEYKPTKRDVAMIDYKPSKRRVKSLFLALEELVKCGMKDSPAVKDLERLIAMTGKTKQLAEPKKEAV